MTKPAWVSRAMKLRDQGSTYIRKSGWGIYEIDELAVGSKLSELSPGSVILRSRSVAGRPPAEIVATAIMVQDADALVAAWEIGNKSFAPLGMYFLGRDEAIAELFTVDIGHNADLVLALDSESYLEIAVSNQKLAQEQSKKTIGIKKSRAAKYCAEEPLRKLRNKLIRANGKSIAEGPGHYSRIARKVTDAYNKCIYDIFPPFHRLDPKTIREILRPDIIPPAKSKNNRRT